jgi:hypothetical protein
VFFLSFLSQGGRRESSAAELMALRQRIAEDERLLAEAHRSWEEKLKLTEAELLLTAQRTQEDLVRKEQENQVWRSPPCS